MTGQKISLCRHKTNWPRRRKKHHFPRQLKCRICRKKIEMGSLCYYCRKRRTS